MNGVSSFLEYTERPGRVLQSAARTRPVAFDRFPTLQAVSTGGSAPQFASHLRQFLPFSWRKIITETPWMTPSVTSGFPAKNKPTAAWVSKPSADALRPLRDERTAPGRGFRSSGSQRRPNPRPEIFFPARRFSVRPAGVQPLTTSSATKASPHFEIGTNLLGRDLLELLRGLDVALFISLCSSVAGASWQTDCRISPAMAWGQLAAVADAW